MKTDIRKQDIDDDLQFEILDVDSIYVSFAASTIFGDTIIEGDISNG